MLYKVKTTKFNNKTIFIYFANETISFEMITNDNAGVVCMSSSISLLYLFCMTPKPCCDFGDFFDDNYVAKRHIITKQINNYGFIIKFGCFHFFKKIATWKNDCIVKYIK